MAKIVFGETTMADIVVRELPALRCWLVVSCYRPGAWKVHPETWLARDAAEQYAARRCGEHLAYAIVRIEVDPRRGPA